MTRLRDCPKIHVIAAVPNALAVEFGRLQLPKAHPPLVLYDRHDGADGLSPVLLLQGGAFTPADAGSGSGTCSGSTGWFGLGGPCASSPSDRSARGRQPGHRRGVAGDAGASAPGRDLPAGPAQPRRGVVCGAPGVPGGSSQRLASSNASDCTSEQSLMTSARVRTRNAQIDLRRAPHCSTMALFRHPTNGG
jgi:hypothetical protein